MLQFYNQAKVLLYINEIEAKEPVFFEVHPSMTCNHQCVWCRYGRDKDQLTLDEMNAIFTKYPKVKGIQLSGGGEPLTNPHTLEFISNAAQLGISIGINSNGELINDKAADVIGKYCTYCRISLDAATADTHQKLHGTKHFDRILDNISNLRHAGIRELGISYLVVEENVREILDLQDLILPVDYIHFKPIIQGIDQSTRDLAILMLKHWENMGLQPKIRWDRVVRDDSNNPKTPCRITRITRLLGGNNREYVCCEKAYQDKFEVDTWNGSTRECLSCRYSGYNEILEQYYKNTMTKELL